MYPASLFLTLYDANFHITETFFVCHLQPKKVWNMIVNINHEMSKKVNDDCWSWNFIFVYFKNLALLCTIMYCWWEKLKISPFFRHHSCILSRLNSEYFKTPGKKLWFKSIPQEKYSLYKKASRELSSLQL